MTIINAKLSINFAGTFNAIKIPDLLLIIFVTAVTTITNKEARLCAFAHDVPTRAHLHFDLIVNPMKR